MLGNSIIPVNRDKALGNSLPKIKNSQQSVHIKRIILTNIKVKIASLSLIESTVDNETVPHIVRQHIRKIECQSHCLSGKNINCRKTEPINEEKINCDRG